MNSLLFGPPCFLHHRVTQTDRPHYVDTSEASFHSLETISIDFSFEALRLNNKIQSDDICGLTSLKIRCGLPIVQ